MRRRRRIDAAGGEPHGNAFGKPVLEPISKPVTKSVPERIADSRSVKRDLRGAVLELALGVSRTKQHRAERSGQSLRVRHERFG